MANAQHSRSTGHGHTQDEVNLEIDDSQSMRQLEEGHQPPILVLSRDPNLVETVKKAAPRGVPVAFAPDLDHVAERLSTLKPGVLVADTASTSDVASMAAQLTQHFPELVVVVAGKREENAQLMQLTATGRIFRFLLTPLSHGATRLSLEAAVKQHLDLAAAGQRLSTGGATGEGGSKNYVMTYGALAAGLLVVIGGIWFGVSQFTAEPEVPPAVNLPTAPGAQQPSGVAERPDPVKAELALAKEAFNQNKFLEPQGESALDLYRSALALDPNSQEAKDGIRSVVEKILERAEAALLAERLEEAIRTIETARDIDSTHPRLAFLDTQVARERERLQLNQAQEVGNRVRQLVSAANDRMANGRLLTPRNGNAQDALLEARRLDPTNPVVLSTIRELSNQLTEEARKSLAAGNLDQAATYIQGAREMGSAGSALAAVERALAEATRTASASSGGAGAGPAVAPSSAPQSAGARRPATNTPAAPQAGSGPNIDGMVAEVRQRLGEGKLIDPPGASARDSLVALRTAAPNRAEVEELSRTLSTRLLDSGRQAMNAKAFDRSAQLIAAARDVGARYNGAAITQAENELAAARDANSQQTNIVSAASLKRVRMVSPVYPDAARKRGIEGWVELAFTVQTNGTVNDVEVRNASPADVFEDAAVRAVRQWRFEPVEKNGEVVEQRAMVRLKFSQQNGG
ncbi:TonB family protein [Steroidobacter sp. S1-65]|uniref:Protein TonB n=1 Tax=Steroidobacter gossypii TaxID=2805490 RepID=A0ABS1WSK3_9GAMM|nr:energy transducer TonB [Steroidobacter gossypii]MBM0103960.1 TonB family protein [Steroidobacter gossypii]